MKRFTRTALASLLGLALSLTITSCDSILDVEPKQEVTPEVALSTQSGFEATLSSAYDDLQDVGYYGQYFMLYPEALADNAINLPGFARYDGPPVNAFREHLNRWGTHYGSINKANIILAEIGDLEIEGASEEEAQAAKDELRGEAYFLRGLNYFDLMRTKAYEPGVVSEGFTQGVIIRTEPTQSEEAAAQFLPRSSITEVYDRIEQDLQSAIDLLGGTGNGKYVANEAAAQSLLAQVYLYEKQFSDAASMATTALESAEENLSADLLTEGEYVDAHTGATMSSGIFVVDLAPEFDGDVTNVNESLSSLTYDPESFNFQLLPTQDLIGAHEQGDVRLELYETLPSGNTRINKYTQAVGSYTDNIPVIRAAEVLLIRAEAYYESGNEEQAREDLNTLRTARGLGEVSPSGQDLINEILRQKRLELAFEGERFFDLKRRGMDIPKPQAPSIGTLPYDDPRILAPIPSQEVDLNPELVQNPGY